MARCGWLEVQGLRQRVHVRSRALYLKGTGVRNRTLTRKLLMWHVREIRSQLSHYNLPYRLASQIPLFFSRQFHHTLTS